MAGDWGSNPLVISVLIFLKFISIKFADIRKEFSMKNLTGFISASFETIWAIGVGTVGMDPCLQ